jgi:hypothetical protein
MNAQTIATEIAAALRDANATPDELTALIQACGPRRQQIRERLLELEPQPHGDSPTRLKAMRSGLDELRKLDEEVAELRRELIYMDHLESELYDARERAINAHVRKEIPKACSRLPAALSAVLDAKAKLEAAVAAGNALVAILGEYGRLESKSMPLTDNELAELLKVRVALWEGFNLSGLQPPGSPTEPSTDYPKSHALFFEVKGDVFRVRRPGVHLTDYQTDDRLSPSQRPAPRRFAI